MKIYKSLITLYDEPYKKDIISRADTLCSAFALTFHAFNGIILKKYVTGGCAP